MQQPMAGPPLQLPGCSGSFVLGGLNKDSSTFLTLGGSTKCKQEDKPNYSACHFRGRVILSPYQVYMKKIALKYGNIEVHYFELE